MQSNTNTNRNSDRNRRSDRDRNTQMFQVHEEKKEGGRKGERRMEGLQNDAREATTEEKSKMREKGEGERRGRKQARQNYRISVIGRDHCTDLCAVQQTIIQMLEFVKIERQRDRDK